MPHVKGHIRQPILDAFEDKAAVDVALGKLWKCTDTVPGALVTEAQDWLVRTRYADLDHLPTLGTFAQLARALKPAIAHLADAGRLRVGGEAA